MDDAVVRANQSRPETLGEERRQGLRQIEGQRAVREEVRVELERLEGELEDRVADGALVRMEEVVLVEVQSDEADAESEQGQKEQGSAKRSRRRERVPRVGTGSFRLR